MPHRILSLYLSVLLALLLAASTHAGVEDDRAELEQTLRRFLAETHERATHQWFWAEELIYTSSSGARYGKAEILAGFEDDTEEERSTPDYGAEDVTIRLMGDIAVVTFRLTADQNGERVGEYFNTGVFRRSDRCDENRWSAFTWQATRIPPGAE